METDRFSELVKFEEVGLHLREGIKALRAYQSEIKIACEKLSEMEQRYSKIESKPFKKQAGKVTKTLKSIGKRLRETGDGCETFADELEKCLSLPFMSFFKNNL